MPTGLLIWKRTVSGNEFFYHQGCVTEQMRRDDIGCHAWDASMVKQEIACQTCGQPIDRSVQKSKRKPFNDRAGKAEVKKAICDAVWERHIDQMATREVATEFGCTLAVARNILMSICLGTSGDERFKPNEERGYGVLLSDGATFAYGSTDANNLNSRHENRPAHYIWFAD